ncbi:MAG: SDR family NAD(P)-dependent oxidoreductase [Phototrophicaceae bacterium]|jgi:NAD(P)-dependent dehydrogenase (short-subunit alcohol dehydrogenase family)
MQVNISGQVAIVTGAAHRVGKAIALELANRGVHIVLHYHQSDPETVRDALHDVKSLGVDALPFQADLSTSAGVAALFGAVTEYFGRLHILVNSASIFQKRTLQAVTLQEWEQTMAINLTAPFLCTQAAAVMMEKNSPPCGAIVNILDRGALQPWKEYAHHGVSKAGLLALTEVSAVSLAPNIRVNGVVPGAVMKPAHLSDADWDATGKRNLLQRTAQAEDVARAVGYLVTEDFISGTILHVDGGRRLTG